MPTIIVEKNERPGNSWRKRYKRLVPARSRLVRPPALYAVPRSLAGVQPKDKIGDWLEMYAKVMESNYWGSHRMQERALRRGEAGVDRRGRSRRRADDTAPATARARDRLLAVPDMPSCPEWRRSGRPASLAAGIPGRKATGQERPW